MFDENTIELGFKNEKNLVLRKVMNIENKAERFDKLISLRNAVDHDMYASYVRVNLQMNTHGVPLETLLKALEGLTPQDLMYRDELEKLEKMPDIITIYRGTDAGEYPPRVSWSLSKDRARFFDQGQMYKATVNKKDIFAYFCNNTNEEEIVAHVTENCDDIF